MKTNLEQVIRESSELSEDIEHLLEEKKVLVCFIAMCLLGKKACEAASHELVSQDRSNGDVESIFRAMQAIAKMSKAAEEAAGCYIGATFDLKEDAEDLDIERLTEEVEELNKSLTDEDVDEAKKSIDGLCESLFNENKDETK